MTKHIELFPGSKADLENMTGETYQAMKYRDGRLMQVETRIFAFGVCHPTDTKDKIDQQLRELVRNQDAHALVHLNYFYASGIKPEQEKINIVGGSGYLVKRV
ncbi:MAG TPA: hypothetical protein VJA18_07365 [Candidatus Nanoarchaeia archaeon]|nr:hypothetical protein [Candidatus Nanoarchaeia archaeon]